MNLVEALYLPGLSRHDQLLAIIYLSGKDAISVSEITDLAATNGLRAARTWNISQCLKRSGTPTAVRVANGWQLTSAGIQVLQSKGITKTVSPVSTTVTSDLRSLLPKLKNNQIREFVDQAIGCYEHRFYRAAVVLSWVGAVSILHARIISSHLPAFNAAAKAKNPKWKDAKTADHLGLMDEGEFLDICATPSVGLLGKNVKEELKLVALKLRNGCGHPNSMVIGPHKVTAHLEFLIDNVFTPLT